MDKVKKYQDTIIALLNDYVDFFRDQVHLSNLKSFQIKNITIFNF